MMKHVCKLLHTMIQSISPTPRTIGIYTYSTINTFQKMIIHTSHDYIPQIISLCHKYGITRKDLTDNTSVSKDTIDRIFRNRDTRHPNKPYKMKLETFHEIIEYIIKTHVQDTVNIQILYTKPVQK